MDRSQLAEVNELYAELTSIEGAFVNLDAGGGIIAITISGGPRNEMPYNPWATVSTAYMQDHIPPQMLDTIKALMQTRREEIQKQLEELGLTVI